MRINFKILPVVVTCLIASCANIDGEYLDGLVKVKTGSTSKEQSGIQKAESSRDECGVKSNRYQQTHHSADQRWCANLTLPGGAFSEVVTYEESVKIPVDIAYIRAKRELSFKDPDDKVSSIYNDNTQWDGIAGSYYGIKARYGGPLKEILWYSDYDLQLEKVDASNTKLKIKYKVYGLDYDPQSFRVALLKAIKEE